MNNNNNNAMTVSEVREEITKMIPLGLPIYIGGSPGLGKTSIARQVAEAEQLPYWEVRAAEFEPVDFRGGMFLDEETETARWFSSEIWPTEKCVLCFDELTQASDEMTSPLLKVIRERAIGKLRLHPETIIIATGNNVSDRAGCKRMSSALRESFIRLDVKADLNSFLKWYDVQNDRNDIVDQFIRQNPELLHQFDGKVDANQPSPRNWHKAGCVLSCTQNESVLAGIVGDDAAESLMAFARSHVSLPSVGDVIDGNAEAPEDFLVQTAWSDAIMQAALSDDYDQVELVKLVDILDTSFAVPLLQAIRREKVSLLRTKAWKPMMLKHADAIAKSMRR